MCKNVFSAFIFFITSLFFLECKVDKINALEPSINNIQNVQFKEFIGSFLLIDNIDTSFSDTIFSFGSNEELKSNIVQNIFNLNPINTNVDFTAGYALFYEEYIVVVLLKRMDFSYEHYQRSIIISSFNNKGELISYLDDILIDEVDLDKYQQPFVSEYLFEYEGGTSWHINIYEERNYGNNPDELNANTTFSIPIEIEISSDIKGNLKATQINVY